MTGADLAYIVAGDLLVPKRGSWEPILKRMVT